MTRNSTKCRRIVIDTHAVRNPAGRLVMKCHCCPTLIDVLKDSKRWRADHIRRHAESGQDTADNLFPICLECDAGPGGKAADDTREVAKGKRVRDNYTGARIKSGFPKSPPGYNPWTRRMHDE